jgi:predicted ATP-grasp superfamily ATP-dependent carboligase
VHGGRVLASFAQVAHRTTPPLGGTSAVRESIPMPADLYEWSVALLAALAYDGYAEVEFRRGADGVPRLMEINPRLSASVEVASRSGVDFPLVMQACAAGRPLPAQHSYRAGVRMRWLGGDLRWLWASVSDPGHPDSVPPARAVGAFAATFGRRYGYDYLDRHDLRPVVRALTDVAFAAVARRPA